jgi:hypothetical protein
VSHTAEKSSNGGKQEAYVIVTDSEANPEALFERYPEIAGSWEELAKFNLLRRPGTAIEMPRAMLSTDHTLAKIAGLYGEAEVKRSFDNRYIPLVENLLLREGDVLRTWRHAGARILFENGNYIVLRSHSKARLISLRPSGSSGRPSVRLELIEGNIWSRTVGKVKGDFVIDTPTASTIIRGTDFRLKVEAGRATRLEVLDGTVEIEAGDETVLVTAQQGILARGGEDVGDVEVLPPAPAELLAPRPEQVVRASSFDLMFRWTPVVGAQSYRLEIARDEGFFDLAEERLTGAKTSVRITGLEPGTYFWRVTAMSPTGFEGPPAGDSYFVFVERHP